MFPPTRAAALARLRDFTPHAGFDYTKGRNFDLPETGPAAVSLLSPYLRHRVLSEREVIGTVLEEHSVREAEKFLQEVFWRTYWKGWLEMRPVVWSQYRQDVQAGVNRLQTEAGLRAEFDAACRGDTDIECFNLWSQQIVSTGYLHNHARMWFASIWIFTLRLPWALGADFFLRHLLDGDPASNTLSWRWVAGMQTRGKTYLATPDNIAKFTNGRFTPAEGSLAYEAPALDAPEPPAPRPVIEPAAILDGAVTGLLLHDDDLWADVDVGCRLEGTCGLICAANRSPLSVSEGVTDFARACLQDRLGDGADPFRDIDAVVTWARSLQLDQIVTPYAPQGPVAEALKALEKRLSAEGITLTRMMRDYDAICWPHAKKGFFPFKANIPDFLNKI